MASIHRSPRTRRALAALAVAIAVLTVAAPAHAHVAAQPATIEAGTRATVGFLVEHGCDGGLETTALEINLPPEVGNPVPGAVPGWTASVAGSVVTFSGGPLGHDTVATFPIDLTAPSASGQLTFPTVQRCGDVVERWIELPVPGQNPEDLDLPAPVVTVTPSTTTTTVPSTTTSTSAGGERPDVSASATESESDSTSPWVYVAVALIAVAIAAGTVVFVRSRRNRSGQETSQ